MHFRVQLAKKKVEILSEVVFAFRYALKIVGFKSQNWCMKISPSQKKLCFLIGWPFQTRLSILHQYDDGT